MMDLLSKRKTCFVIADPRDNSVTLSESLAKRLKVLKRESTRVFVFWIPAIREYGFVINPPLGDDVQVGTVQYNSKHRCVGFECLNPTVTRMLYEYLPNAPHDVAVKLSVRVHKRIKMGDGKHTIFVIERPEI